MIKAGNELLKLLSLHAHYFYTLPSHPNYILPHSPSLFHKDLINIHVQFWVPCVDEDQGELG